MSCIQPSGVPSIADNNFAFVVPGIPYPIATVTPSSPAPSPSFYTFSGNNNLMFAFFLFV